MRGCGLRAVAWARAQSVREHGGCQTTRHVWNAWGKAGAWMGHGIRNRGTYTLGVKHGRRGNRI
eukprot:6214959-Alexandrium_andersonii.AAC.1